MEMSARDFSQYYHGTFIRGRKTRRVFYVEKINDEGIASLKYLKADGTSGTKRMSQKDVLAQFELGRFQLGWAWDAINLRSVYVTAPAGRGYKKGHIENGMSMYCPPTATKRRVMEADPHVEAAIIRAGIEEVVREKLDQAYVRAALPPTGALGRDAVDDLYAAVSGGIMRKYARRLAAWSTSFSVTLPRRAGDLRNAPKLGSLKAVGRMGIVDVLAVLGGMSSSFSLPEAVRLVSDHAACGQLCYRVDNMLALVISDGCPKDGAYVMVGPNRIGYVSKGTITLYDEYAAAFEPYINRQLKEK